MKSRTCNRPVKINEYLKVIEYALTLMSIYKYIYIDAIRYVKCVTVLYIGVAIYFVIYYSRVFSLTYVLYGSLFDTAMAGQLFQTGCMYSDEEFTST